MCEILLLLQERLISNKTVLVFPPHLKYVAALPWETLNYLHRHVPGDIVDTAIQCN